ncbi:MAG: AmmeMemoRadiSam system radical SAM enzyme [Candidatus Ratteibacteria bacterium]|nr:AmmeMemoRadiSam system radical SAM enzyme [Candidatus Ratteibacteria bacterium]
MKEAGFYQSLDNEKVRCALCRHRCLILPGKRGICGVRENRGGKLYSLVYGQLIAQHIDPIEKKPLFHFLPGSLAYSIAAAGCNFRCLHCQNYDISQYPRFHQSIIGEKTTPREVVEKAGAARCQSISYTYTEPTIFMEFAGETAKLAKSFGLRNNFVTNGYMTPEAMEYMKGYLDAANVDLKSFRDEFYKKICGARLQPVLETLKFMKKINIWLEVTTLIIPGLNDSEEELKDIAQFITKELGPEVPWHVTQFYPTYEMSHLPRTPVETLRKAREIGKNTGLHYVYCGNVPGDEGENTFCYNCGRLLIRRLSFQIAENRMIRGYCPDCGTAQEGIWEIPGECQKENERK